MAEAGSGRWLREPLLHFLVLGAGLFAVDAALRSEGPEAEPEAELVREVVVDRALRDELRERLTTRLGHPPSADELAAAQDDWVHTEVLYREGLARGFDANDPAVRERVASRMGRVVRESVALPEPTDAELRTYFGRDPGRWARDARMDFTQVFVAADDPAAEPRAAALLDELRAGANPAGLGDPFSGGRRYRQRRLDDLEAAFGAGFVEGLDEQPIGSWALRRSRAGLHLVRVDERRGTAAPDFDAVRDDVARAWREEHEAAAVQEAMAELMERWTVVGR